MTTNKGKSTIASRIEKAITKYVKDYLDAQEIEPDECLKGIKKILNDATATKPKKPKDMPKTVTSYIYFTMKNREKAKKICEDNDEKDPKEVMKKLGDMWKELTDEEKEEWKKKTDKYNTKVKKELAAYEKTEMYQEYKKKLDEFEEKHPTAKKKASPRPKGENQPKPPPTAWMTWSKEFRSQVKENTQLILDVLTDEEFNALEEKTGENFKEKVEEGKIKGTDISKLLGAMWKRLKSLFEKKKKASTAEKKLVKKFKIGRHLEDHKKAQETYKDQLEEWKETDEYDEVQEKLKEWKEERKSGDSARKKMPGKARKKAVHKSDDEESESDDEESESDDKKPKENEEEIEVDSDSEDE